MLTKKQCKSQRKISQESAFPPHGRMESCNGCELLFRQYRGAHGNWQGFGSANAWGKWTSTALDVESNVASPLDEPGTPCILCRGVSVANPLHKASQQCDALVQVVEFYVFAGVVSKTSTGAQSVQRWDAHGRRRIAI